MNDFSSALSYIYIYQNLFLSLFCTRTTFTFCNPKSALHYVPTRVKRFVRNNNIFSHFTSLRYTLLKMRFDYLLSFPRSSGRYRHPIRHVASFHTNLHLSMFADTIRTMFFQPVFGSKSPIEAAPSVYGFQTTTSLKFSRWIERTGLL